VAFSRAGAIQRLGGQSIRRTCGYLSQMLNTVTHCTTSPRGWKSAESAVAIRSEFLAKGNYATACKQNRSRNLMITSTLALDHRVFFVDLHST